MLKMMKTMEMITSKRRSSAVMKRTEKVSIKMRTKIKRVMTTVNERTIDERPDI
jgi:hypothetical protein